jgi:microsomal dipeptidase-like Zn-dependent dipeptidase
LGDARRTTPQTRHHQSSIYGALNFALAMDSGARRTSHYDDSLSAEDARKIVDASETFNVTLELVRRGYTEEQIDMLWSGNLLRVLDDVQRIAAEIQAEERAES